MNTQLSIRFFTGTVSKLTIFVVILGMLFGAALPTAAAAESMLNPTQPDGFIIYEPERITFAEERSHYPLLLIDDKDNKHIIWQDTRNDPDPDDLAYLYEIYYKKYNHKGKLVVDDTRLTNATDNTAPRGFFTPGPSSAFDSDGNIHLAYDDFTKHKYAGTRMNVEISYLQLAGDMDAGGEPADRDELVLIDEQRVSEGGAHSGSADLQIDSEDNVHIVYYDHRSFSWNWEVYYEKLSKNGDVLIDDKRLTYNLDYIAGPELLIDSNDDLHLAFKSYDWSDDLNTIYYMKLNSDAEELIAPKVIFEEGVITPTPYGKMYPAIEMDSDENIHLAWVSEHEDSVLEVYYLKLDNDGDALMSDEMRLTDNAVASYLQEFAIGPDDTLYFGIRQQVGDYHQMFLTIMEP